MRYGLGSLKVTGSQERLVLLTALMEEYRLAGERARGPVNDAERARQVGYVRDLQAAASLLDDGTEPVRDLLDVLPRGGADRAWLTGLHDALVRPDVASERLILTCCEHEGDQDGGTLSLAAMLHRRWSEVRAGDVVHAGFAATSDRAGEVRIAPRLFRVNCTNGALTAVGDGQERLCTAESAADAVQACLSGSVFAGEMQRLRQAAGTAVGDPEALLQRARAHSRWSEVRAAFEREQDHSVWGLINAVTAVARGSRTWAERLRREGDAAGILALLETPPLQRMRSLQLALPRPETRVPVHTEAGVLASA